MRFPKMRPKSASRVRIPDLFGGVNLRDSLSEVLDSQLTYCKNVWSSDGVLKTRPGVKTLSETHVSWITSEQNVSSKLWPKVKYKASGKEYVLTVIKKDQDFNHTGHYETTLKFCWQGKNEALDICSLSFNEQVSYFVTQDDSTIYVFASNCEIYKLEYSRLNPENNFVKLEEKDMYVPTIAINCYSGLHAVGGEAPEMLLAGATMINGFNLIGNRAKFFYSTVNLDLLTDESPNQYMIYDIPYLGENRTLIPQLLEVTVTYLNGSVVTHTATQYDGQLEYESMFYESECQADDLKIEVYCNGSNGQIVFCDKNGETSKVTKEDYILNNLEVIIPVVSSDEERARAFGATQCEWFGGGTEGIAGGTRLFLGGNTSEANKNLVVWSDLNNPLYFPENNYFRVGESSSAVTGFGKQADMLVIFKENGSGIYYTKYQQNSDISVEDLINQSVVDYVASSVYFPLVQVNPNIGCSNPETIQLCRNRLVWLGDNGDVFTLVNESQYNERSVFCVSEMVRRDLRQSISGTPTACDWNGYYCLLVANNFYLMDYNCYGYTHISGYSKTEDANVRIPWYIWELPRSLTGSYMCAINGEILFSHYNNLDGNADSAVWNYLLNHNNVALDELFNADELNGIASHGVINQSIQTTLRTKLFDFGEPNTRKSIDKINLQLGNNGGERISVKVITDQSEEEHDIYLTGSETQAYTPGYIDSKAIFPCARNVLRVGLEISSEGVVAVDGMEIKFRLLGGSR